MRAHPVLSVWVCLLGLGPALGCGSNSSQPEPFTPPDARGDFPAGSLSTTLPGPDGLELPVVVWYPAAEGREQAVDYDGLGLTHGRAVVDGAAACAQPRPVVVFSHGNGGIGFQSYTLTEHLARHGWLVVAPDHVHNTFFDSDDGLWAALVLRRPLDVAATFDWLAEQSAGSSSPLSGCVDPAAGYAVMGHSFGGFTSLAVAGASLDMARLEADCLGDDGPGCQVVRDWRAAHPGQDRLDRSDPRAWAAVPLAPAWPQYFGAGLGDIRIPSLVVGGQLDDLTSMDSAVEPCYRGLQAVPRYLAELEGAGHYSFTDFCPVVGTDFNGCGPEARAPAEVLETLRTLGLAFLLSLGGEIRAGDWLPPPQGVSHWEAVED